MTVRSLPIPPAASTTSAVEVLAEIAKSVVEPGTTQHVLAAVVRAARDLLDADRASLLLVEDGRLTPAVSIARRGQDDELWKRFRDMPPMQLDVHPSAAEVLGSRRATVVTNASASELIPDEWCEAFGLTSLAFVPLAVGEILYGVLAVDHVDGPHQFTEEQLRALEGVGALASQALDIAHGRQQADRQVHVLEEVLAIAARLNATRTLADTLDAATEAFLTLLGGHTCTLASWDPPDTLTVLASRGVCAVGCGSYGPGVLTEDDRIELGLQSARPSLRLWDPPPAAEAAGSALARIAGGGRLLVVPFAEAGRAHGFAFVGLPDGDGKAADTMLFSALLLANQVWLAINQVRDREQLERQLEFLQALNELADDIIIQPEMRLIVERLAPVLRRATGIEILDVAIRNPHIAKLFGTTTPRGIVAERLRRLRPSDGPRWLREGSLIVVPLMAEGEVIGALQARVPDGVDPTPTDAEFLISCGTHVAWLVARTALRVQVAEGEREIAVAEDRARTQQQLQETVGRYLAQLRLRLQRLQIRRTGDGIDDCLQLLQRTESYLKHGLSLPGGPVDPSQSSFHHRLKEVLGINPRLDGALRIRGRAWELEPRAANALLRVAARFVELAGQDGAVIASLTLSYQPSEVELLLGHNGPNDLMASSPHGIDTHTALAEMREWMHQVGGEFTFRRLPAGLVFSARLPRP